MVLSMRASPREGSGGSAAPVSRREETERAIRMVTSELPGPKAKEKIERFNRNVSNVRYHILNGLFQETTIGSLITDPDGNRFVDMLSGVGVNAIGGAHPKVVAAVNAQMQRGAHFNMAVAPFEVYGEFLTRLTSTMPEGLRTGGGILGNSGAEAVEAAMKLARSHTDRPIIIALDPCFHGRTAAALAATTGAKGRKHLGGALTGVVHASYPYAYRAPEGVNVTDWAIGTVENVLRQIAPKENVAALIMETIAGEPGVIIPPKDYLPRLQKLLKENGILHIADEVQVGIGKTGRPWAVDHFGVTPDIITFAKAAGGGLPLGGIVARKEISDAWPSGHHASTFGGNAVACAAGIATLDVMQQDGLVDRAARTGEAFLKRLREIDSELIGEVRGAGMLFGLELVTDQRRKTPAVQQATEIKEAALRQGVALSTTGPYGNVVRLSPALNIPQQYLDEAAEVLERAFKQVKA